jgi:hypothetical protein
MIMSPNANIQLMTIWIGTVLNDWLSPWIYNEMGLSSAVWFGFVICFGSLLCGVSAVTHTDSCRHCDFG